MASRNEVTYKVNTHKKKNYLWQSPSSSAVRSNSRCQLRAVHTKPLWSALEGSRCYGRCVGERIQLGLLKQFTVFNTKLSLIRLNKSTEPSSGFPASKDKLTQILSVTLNNR